MNNVYKDLLCECWSHRPIHNLIRFSCWVRFSGLQLDFFLLTCKPMSWSITVSQMLEEHKGHLSWRKITFLLTVQHKKHKHQNICINPSCSRVSQGGHQVAQIDATHAVGEQWAREKTTAFLAGSKLNCSLFWREMLLHPSRLLAAHTTVRNGLGKEQCGIKPLGWPITVLASWDLLLWVIPSRWL